MVHHLLGSGSHSPLAWTAAAGSLEPMGGDALIEGECCTFLLSTRAGPVPQVLLANTSGIHSRGGAARGAGGRGCKTGIIPWVQIQTRELSDDPQRCHMYIGNNCHWVSLDDSLPTSGLKDTGLSDRPIVWPAS